jgi:hypothetical protein
MLRGLYEDPSLRHMVPYYLSLYGLEGPATLYFGDFYRWLSEEGCQQGCSLGVLLYILAVSPVIEKLMEEFPNVSVLGFVDDYYFCGLPEETARCYERYGQLLSEQGMALNHAKGFVWSRSAASLACPAIQAVSQMGITVVQPDQGIKVVGAPVGADDWCKDWLLRKGEKVGESIDAIEKLGTHDHACSVQSALLLMRYCAVPRVNHLLRGCPPSLVEEMALLHDRRIMSCFSRLLGPGNPLCCDVTQSPAHVTDGFGLEQQVYAQRRVQQPLKLGGIGLPSALKAMPAAYVGAWADCISFFRQRPSYLPEVQALLTVEALEAAEQAGATGPLAELGECWSELEGSVHTGLLPGGDRDGSIRGSAVLGMKVSQVLGAEVRRPSALGAAGRRVQDKLRGACERELHAQLSLVAEDDEVREDCRQTAPTPKDVVRLKACMDESAAWLLAIPYNPTVRLSNAEMRGQLAFRLHVPLPMLQQGSSECDCHRNHDERVRQEAHARRRVRTGSRRRVRRRRPKRVDGYGDHDMTCPHGGAFVRHNSVQCTYVSLCREAGAQVRRTTVLELRTDPNSTSQKQADVAIDCYGEAQDTCVVDFVGTHPTAATYFSTYGQSGDCNAKKEIFKKGKYGKDCEELGMVLIPFAFETYGKLGADALKNLKQLGQMEAQLEADLTFRPWFERSFMDRATQRLSVALQRSIFRDQLKRSHGRRSRSPYTSSSSDSSSDGY